MKDIISTGNSDSTFFLGVMPLFKLRNLTKIKDTYILKTDRQRNSTETTQQNFVKLCSYEEYNV